MITIDFLAKLLSLPFVVIKAVVLYYTVGTVYSRTNKEFKNSLWKNVLLSTEFHFTGDYKKENMKAVIYEPIESVFKKLSKSPMVKPLNCFGEKFDERSYWVHKANSPKVLVYYHGGGYLLNMFKSQLTFAASLHYALSDDVAEQLSIMVVDYSLSMFDHAFPTQTFEAIESYSNLVKAGYDQIHLIGDSAGGHLALSVARAIAYPKEVLQMSLDFNRTLKADIGSLPAPASLIPVSPWVQPTIAPKVPNRRGINTWGDLGSTDTSLGNLWIAGVPEALREKYCGNINLTSADDWSRVDFSNTLIIVGERETLRDGIDDFVAMINDDGKVQYFTEPGGIHAGLVYVESLDYAGRLGGKRALKGNFKGKYSYNLIAGFLNERV